MESTMKMKISRDDRIFDIISYIILGLILIVTLYPIYFVVIASFSDPTLVGSGQIVFWPKGLALEGYEQIFKDKTIWRGLFNSVYIVILATLFNLFLTLPTAYVLTVKSFMFRSTLSKLLLFTMYFSGGLIPTYMVVSGLGLYNKPYTLIFLGGVSITNVIIAQTTIAGSIPYEMYEAVTIDGGDHFTFFTRFVLPLSKTIIAVLILYYGVEHWNDYYTGLIYLNDAEYFPLQLILRNILVLGQKVADDAVNADEALAALRRAELLKYCLIVVSSVPMFLIYPFIQKYFERGVMIGSVKG